MFWGWGLAIAIVTSALADDVLILFSETQQFPGNLGDRETTSSHCRGTDEYAALGCTDAFAFLSYRRDPLIDLPVNGTLPWIGPYAQIVSLNTSQLFVESDQCSVAGLDPASATLVNSFAEAGVISPGDLFWSGTTKTGCASESTCNEWQSASSCSSGMAGSGSTRTVAVLYGVAPQWCSQLRRLICVCVGGTPLGTGSPSTLSPTNNPTQFPTFSPATNAPSTSPTNAPTGFPSQSPSIAPTTSGPTNAPITSTPTTTPTTSYPSVTPTAAPFGALDVPVASRITPYCGECISSLDFLQTFDYLNVDELNQSGDQTLVFASGNWTSTTTDAYIFVHFTTMEIEQSYSQDIPQPLDMRVTDSAGSRVLYASSLAARAIGQGHYLALTIAGPVVATLTTTVQVQRYVAFGFAAYGILVTTIPIETGYAMRSAAIRVPNGRVATRIFSGPGPSGLNGANFVFDSIDPSQSTVSSEFTYNAGDATLTYVGEDAATYFIAVSSSVNPTVKPSKFSMYLITESFPAHGCSSFTYTSEAVDQCLRFNYYCQIRLDPNAIFAVKLDQQSDPMVLGDPSCGPQVFSATRVPHRFTARNGPGAPLVPAVSGTVYDLEFPDVSPYVGDATDLTYDTGTFEASSTKTYLITWSAVWDTHPLETGANELVGSTWIHSTSGTTTTNGNACMSYGYRESNPSSPYYHTIQCAMILHTIPGDTFSVKARMYSVDDIEGDMLPDQSIQISEWPSVEIPTASPTTSPSPAPSVAPATRSPTTTPTAAPTTSTPTVAPTTSNPTAAPITKSPTNTPTSSPVGDGSTFILPYSPTTHNGNFGGTAAARLVCVANYQALNLPCDDAALLVGHITGDTIQNFPTRRGFDPSKNVRFAVPGSPIVASSWPTFAPVTLAPTPSPLSYASLGLVPSSSPVTQVWGGWNPGEDRCTAWSVSFVGSGAVGSTQVAGAGRFYDGASTQLCLNSYWALCACWKYSASPTATPTGTPTTSFPTVDPTRSPSKAPTTTAPTKAPTTTAPTKAPTTSTPTRAPAPVVITMGRRGTSQTVPTSTTTTLTVPTSDPVTQVGSQSLTYAPTGVFSGTAANVYLVIGYAKATYTASDTLNYYQAYIKTVAATVTSYAAQLGGYATSSGTVGTGLVVAAVVRTASSSDTIELQVRQGTGSSLAYGAAWPVGPTADGSSGSTRIRAFQMPSGTVVTARRHTSGCQGAINGAPAAVLFDTDDATTSTGTSQFDYLAGKFTVKVGQTTRPYFFSASVVYATTGGGGFRWAWFNANVAGFGTHDGGTSLSIGTATASQCTSSATFGVIVLAAADWIQFGEQQNSGGDLCMAPTSCSAGLADHYLQRAQLIALPPHVLGMRTTTTQSLSANTDTLMVFGSTDASANLGSPTVAYSAGTFTFSATRTFLITGSTGTSGCGTALTFMFWMKYTPFGGQAQDMASFSGWCLSGNYVAGNIGDEIQVNNGDTIQFYARSTAAATINTFVYNTYAAQVRLVMMN